MSRRLLLGAAAGALAGAVLLGACSRDPEAGPSPNESTPPGTTATGAPSFGLPQDPAAALRAANLHDFPLEDAKVSFRSHLDVIVDDHPVAIPAGLGVLKTSTSPVTTADGTGVIHVNEDKTAEPPGPDEVGKVPTYSVGQLFAEWEVRLDKSCLATWCNDDQHQLLGFVNGQLVADPASIPFRPNDQIVVWYGPKGTNPKVPASYAFPAGT